MEMHKEDEIPESVERVIEALFVKLKNAVKNDFEITPDKMAEDLKRRLGWNSEVKENGKSEVVEVQTPEGKIRIARKFEERPC